MRRATEGAMRRPRFWGWVLIAYEGFKFVVDWLGRIDVVNQYAKLIANSVGEISLFAETLLENVLYPPSWTTLPIIFLGLSLLYLDSRRARAEAAMPTRPIEPQPPERVPDEF